MKKAFCRAMALPALQAYKSDWIEVSVVCGHEGAKQWMARALLPQTRMMQELLLANIRASLLGVIPRRLHTEMVKVFDREMAVFRPKMQALAESFR